MVKTTLPNCDAQIFCDVSTGRARPYIPNEFRHDAFYATHNLSHPRTRSTTKLVTSRFIWHNIRIAAPGHAPAWFVSRPRYNATPDLH